MLGELDPAAELCWMLDWKLQVPVRDSPNLRSSEVYNLRISKRAAVSFIESYVIRHPENGSRYTMFYTNNSFRIGARGRIPSTMKNC